ncbi:MAG: heavy-metal-associated domain-containing protein [Burkholderiaceae bacterium]|nr:heavy-metal-associated domain-containing protein [Microbacteriaceae bacterium]
MVTTDYLVSGMTCQHCVASVQEELSDLAGVESVETLLNNGGLSRVSVTSSTPLDADVVRAAITEAGYDLAEDGTAQR